MAQVNAVIMIKRENKEKRNNLPDSLQISNMSLETKTEGSFLHLVWTYDIQESKSHNKDVALMHSLLSELDAQDTVEAKLQELGLPFFLYDELAYDNDITLSDMTACIGKEVLFQRICKLEDAAKKAQETVMGRAQDEELYEAIRDTITFAKKAFMA